MSGRGATGSSAAIPFLLLFSIVSSMIVPSFASGYEPNVHVPAKPKIENGGYGSNVPKPNVEKPKIGYDYTSKKTMGIQGLIYCKSGSKLIPLKGAKARITCLALDKNGYESAPFSVSSCPSDAKGYFFATLSPVAELLEEWKIKECKAFLENSPWEDCDVPTELNKGISGAPLLFHRLLNNMNLYSVGPFVYTVDTKPVYKVY